MTKVFVIDDSLTVRNGFKTLLSQMDDIELIGTAQNPIDALDMFSKVGLPDLFILDIEMPKMDGLTFLKKINEQRPTPVIICSTLVGKSSTVIIDALRLGASEVIEKPKNNLNTLFLEYREELMEKIYAVTKANINYKNKNKPQNKTKTCSSEEIHRCQTVSSKIIAIGSSTGGVQVLEEIVTQVKKPHSGIVVVQHIPKQFSSSLAHRLNELSFNSCIKEAENNEMICNNTIYIAPGGIHIEIEKRGLKFYIVLKDFPKVNAHKPSINVLFNSISKVAKSNALGFILTGMGDDGAKGLKDMLDSGARTYVQNKKTSTVYGMPSVAWEMGSAIEELSIHEIINMINKN